MTSRLKIFPEKEEETDGYKVNMKELTTANNYVRNYSKQLYKPSNSNDYKINETYIIKLKRDTDKLIDLYQNGDDKINTIERIKQYLKKNN